jgi:hypothetical protein
MNCDIDYKAWCVLEAVAQHPEIAARKRRIIDRTLERIEQSTRREEAEELAEIHRLERGYGLLLPWLSPGVEAEGS